MKKIFCFVLFLFFCIFNPKLVYANQQERFITIVNPVRISSYTKNPSESLKSEYLVIKRNNLPATWLLTYDALEDDTVLSVIKDMDKKQEFGIFLEVTKNFSEKSGVSYHNTGFWHHATSVFLSGYSQEERKILIDKVFGSFKEKFGYYPVSVGSWWTDSFSLSYMKEKYGIIANLICSDQLSTDGYQIWGQPWALPYYPSKFYTSVPASDMSNKLDIVNLQWAPRDPLNGYESSLYSTQDYQVASKSQDTNYFEKLVKLYSSYGQITVGLESDANPSAYESEFANQMKVVNKEREIGVSVTTMSDFANWYRQKYPTLTPNSFIESNDFLETNTKSFWYTSPNYRLFYTKNGDGDIQIKDLRVYDSGLEEPYFISPNNSFNLSINIPYVLNVSEDKDAFWNLPQGSTMLLDDNFIEIKGKNINIPSKVKNSELIKLKRENNSIVISFPKQNMPGEGVVIKDFSAEAIHFLKQKKAILHLVMGRGWNYFKKVNYLIPQGEIYALLYLKSLPSGKVMVYDNECLQCVYHTQFPPPALSNRRDYIKKYSGHPIVYNSSIFNATDRQKAKTDLKNIRVKYIYLVKFEEYKENLPFSPGDLGIKKIFSNANAEIWEVI